MADKVADLDIKDPKNIRKLYDRLTDIPSRVRFLIDLKKYQIACDENEKPVSKEQADMIDELEVEFYSKYITKGSTDTRKKVFETVGLLKAENSYNCYREYNRQLNKLPINDSTRTKKAEWLMRHTSVGIENQIINQMTMNIKSISEGDDQIRYDTYHDMGINGSLTMEEFALKCGVRKKDIPAFLRNRNTSADTNIVTYYSGKYPNVRKESLGNVIGNDVLETLNRNWISNVTKDYIASKNLSSDQMRVFDHVSVNNNLSPSFEGIQDWIDDRGKKLAIEDNLDGLKELGGIFFERNLNGKKVYSEDRYRQDEELRKTYNELSTLEEKLQFILDLAMYNDGRNEKFGNVLKFDSLYKELLNDYLDKYITKGTADTSDRTLKFLGAFSTANLLKLREEDEKLRNEFKAEGVNGEKKAANISQWTTGGMYSSNLRKIIGSCIGALVKDESHAKRDIISKKQIRPEMTIYEYAVKVGMPESKIQKYITDHNATPETKMSDVIRAQIGGGSDAAVRISLRDEFIREYSNMTQSLEAIKALDNVHLDDDKLEHYYKISQNMSGEIDESGIGDWLKGEGKQRIDETAHRSGLLAISDFTRKYVKQTGFDRYISLHIGSDAVTSDTEKRLDCLAKSVIASTLKKCGSKFDIKRIRSLAENLKHDQEFLDKVKDQDLVSKALTDTDGIDEFKNRLYAPHCVIAEDSGEKYVEYMNDLHKSMLPSEGRSEGYKALYDAVKKISDLKGAYDESLPADRAARDALISELNINLYYAVKEYVSGKEKVRTTTNGQKRFGDALDAISILASFTPGMKHKAQKIFNTINARRKAKEGSEKFVSLSDYEVVVHKNVNAEVKIDKEEPKNVKEEPKNVKDASKSGTPSYLKKTDAALARLKEGKYEDDPDHRKFLTDAVYALVGQMVRITGGAALTDRNTGKPITFKQFLDRCIGDGIVQVFKKDSSPTGVVSVKEAYARVNHGGFLMQMVDAGAKPDAGVKVPEEPILKGDEAYAHMMGGFVRDIEHFAQLIDSTFGEGKTQAKPDKSMGLILDGLKGFTSRNGKKAAETVEDRISDALKDSHEDYRAKLEALYNFTDAYLEKNQNPSDPDQAERRQYLISLKRKLADYKREFEVIGNGGTCFAHEPKMAMMTKGESITYNDLKKNLVAFTFDMADLANEGKSILFRYDPESFLPDLFGEDKRPGKPSVELDNVFTVMKKFRNLFSSNEKGEVHPITFDRIKEMALELSKAVAVCSTSMKGKDVDPNLVVSLESLADTCQNMFRMIEAMQPYMDIKTLEGRLGDKNVYDVVKTMDNPYRNIMLITTEQYIQGRCLPTEKQCKAALKAWVDTNEAFGKEKNLFQKKISKANRLRDKIFFDKANLYGYKLYMEPVGSDIDKKQKADRKNNMLCIAARDIFLKLTDDDNMWTELKKAGTDSEVENVLFNDMAKNALEKNPAFLKVHEKATYGDIAAKVLDYARKKGTLDKLKRDLSPKKLIETLKAQKVRQAEAKKQTEGAVKAPV